MRFRTDLVPVALVVSATAVTTPIATGCKKQDSAAADAATKGPIIIKQKDDIPVELGGKAAPYTPPPSSAPKPASEGKTGGGSKSGGEGKAAAVEPPPAPSAVAITHNHPPDQPCQPLKREEVEKALTDLKSKPQ